MTRDFMVDVLDTLRGNMTLVGGIPNVENLYEEGKPYYQCYENMFHAYERLRDRLCVIDEDEDVEIMIGAFLEMESLVAEKMFFYGAHFALDEYLHKNNPEYFR